MRKRTIITAIGWALVTLSGVAMAALTMWHRAQDPSLTETQLFIVLAPALVLGILVCGIGLVLIILGQPPTPPTS